MANEPNDTRPASWHQFFAIECNNRAWDLSVKDRSHDEDIEMLNAAHAAAHHWHQIGNELNDMRATMLLAEVHAALGYGPSAMQYADAMTRYFLKAEETPDWELALAHAIHAHAAGAAGNAEAHAASYRKAVEAIAAIADAQDRAIVNDTFERVPKP